MTERGGNTGTVISASDPGLEDDQYYAYLCDGSAPLTPQLEAELGPLRPVAARTVPEPATPVEPRAAATTAPDSDGPAAALLVIGGGAVLLVGAGALALRRRRAR